MIRTLRQLFASPKLPPAPPPVFSLPEGVRVYAVGDIHGRSGLLQKMLTTIARDAAQHPGKRIVEVFLGDYVDRGMDSREVIDLLIAPPTKGHERVCLMGNHEETLLRFLNEPQTLRGWGNYGGYATLASYGIPIPPSMSPQMQISVRDQLQKNLPAAHRRFLHDLPLIYQSGDYLFVHAGILPQLPLDQQKSEDLLWIRAPFLRHRDFFPHYVVHGHSPVTTPEILSNRANLDVSAAPSPSLCCLALENNERQVILITDESD